MRYGSVMIKPPAFITQLDKQAVRAIAVTAAMFGLAIVMIVLGGKYLGVNEGALHELFSGLASSAWALPATIAVFVLAAFIGTPQWALIAAAVLAFGPAQGFAFAWIATLVSALVDFSIGRAMGAERLNQYGGPLVGRIMALVQRNGFVTSFTVRLVPTGPFVLVNMAAGVSRMTYAAFMAGTALGIIPKIAAVAFLGQSLLGALQGSPALFAVGLAGFFGVIIGGMLFARRKLTARNAKLEAIEQAKK